MGFLPQRWPWRDRTPAEMPKEIRNKLANTEQSIRGGQIHEATMYEPITSTVLGLIAVIVLVPRFNGSPVLVDFLFLGFLTLLGRMAWRWFEWTTTRIFFTGYRIIYVHGIITRQLAMLPIGKVTDMRYDRTPDGMLFGYGKFIIESAGQDQALRVINFVPDPDETYRYIQNLLFSKGTQNVNIIDVNMLDKRKAIPVEVRNKIRQANQSQDTTVVDDNNRPWWAE
jgi:hypothetical protein